MGVSMVGNSDQKVKNRLIRFLLKDKLGIMNIKMPILSRKTIVTL
jgi:hypothetical protein